MSDAPIERPGPDEFAPFYAGYVKGVADGDPLALLAGSSEEMELMFAAIGEARAERPTAPGKWSPKDVLLHVIDAERVFAYRAMRIARGDETPLPGFDQDLFARNGGANARTLDSLLEEYRAVRASTLAFFRGLDRAAFARRGSANEQPVSVRAMLYIVLGHEAHHWRGLASFLASVAPALPQR